MVTQQQRIPLPLSPIQQKQIPPPDSSQSILQTKKCFRLVCGQLWVIISPLRDTSSHGNLGLTIIRRTFTPGGPEPVTKDRGSPHQSGGSNLPLHGLPVLSPCHLRLTGACAGEVSTVNYRLHYPPAAPSNATFSAAAAPPVTIRTCLS